MKLVQMSLTAGTLIVFIVLLRMLFMYRIPKKVFFVLWGIVLVRLLLPVSVSVSVPSFLPWTTVEEAIATKIQRQDSAETLSMQEQSPIRNTVNNEIKADLEAERMVDSSTKKESIFPKTKAMDRLRKTISERGTAFEWLWKILYAAGVLFTAFIFLLLYRQSYMCLAQALPLREETIQRAWETYKVTRRNVQLFVSDQISTPMTYGVIHPKVVLPKGIDCSQNLEYILMHESIHIKRMDALWKILILTATSIHWWNPLVWVMMILANRDLEISCDEEVLSRWGAQKRTQYAMTLIQLAEQKNSFSPFVSGFGKNAVQERIVAIMKYKKVSTAGIFVGVFLIVSSLTVFAAAETTSSSKLGDYVIETQQTEVNEIYNVEPEQTEMAESEAEQQQIQNQKERLDLLTQQEQNTQEEVVEQEMKIYMIGLDEEDKMTAENQQSIEEMTEWLKAYEIYGIVFDQETRQLFYHNYLIGYFEDLREESDGTKTGRIYCDEKVDSPYGVTVVYDGNGNMAGVRLITIQDQKENMEDTIEPELEFYSLEEYNSLFHKETNSEETEWYSIEEYNSVFQKET